MLDKCFRSTGGATIAERLCGISGASDGQRRGELWEKGHTVETQAWSQERHSGSTSAADAGADTLLTFYTMAEAIQSRDNLQCWGITANSWRCIFIIIRNESTYLHLMYSIRFHSSDVEAASGRCRLLIRIAQRQKANSESLILIWMRLTMTVRAGVSLHMLWNSAFCFFFPAFTRLVGCNLLWRRLLSQDVDISKSFLDLLLLEMTITWVKD